MRDLPQRLLNSPTASATSRSPADRCGPARPPVDSLDVPRPRGRLAVAKLRTILRRTCLALTLLLFAATNALWICSDTRVFTWCKLGMDLDGRCYGVAAYAGALTLAYASDIVSFIHYGLGGPPWVFKDGPAEPRLGFVCPDAPAKAPVDEPLWGFRHEVGGPGFSMTIIRIPLAVPASSFLLSAALLSIPDLRRWRRRRRGLCVRCGYDLRASADRCPECGRAIG